VRSRLPVTLIAAVAIACAAAPAALADSSQSSNWAGYAVHRAGVTFRSVQAVWRTPGAACSRGSNSYSAAWVGLGGYSETSNALEQTGTETDCSQSGRSVTSAWYELVPAPSEPIALRVHAGDEMGASVTVQGSRVTVVLDDLTTHRSFQRSLFAPTVDVTSAEWIVEAPSDCFSEYSCQTLPLADFGSTTFSSAFATSTTFHRGTISDPDWGSTRITLIPGGRRYIVYQGQGATTGAASPSSLTRAGTSFKVTYSTITIPGNPYFSSRRALVDGYLVHPGR
jgi:Peptidase A4 family